MLKKTTILFIGLFFVVAIVGCKAGPTVVWEAQTVDLTDAAEIAAAIQSEKGKVLVLNFWASWCLPCVEELPALSSFYEQYKGRGVTIYGVSLDDPDTLESLIKPFIAKNNIPYAIRVLTDRDVDLVSQAVKTPITGALPVSLIYDRKGRLVHSQEGLITLEMLEEFVKPLL